MANLYRKLTEQEAPFIPVMKGSKTAFTVFGCWFDSSDPASMLYMRRILNWERLGIRDQRMLVAEFAEQLEKLSALISS